MKDQIIEQAEILLGSLPNAEENVIAQESKVKSLAKVFVKSAATQVSLSATWEHVITRITNPQSIPCSSRAGYLIGAENVLRLVQIAPSRLDHVIEGGRFLYKKDPYLKLEYISYFDMQKIKDVLHSSIEELAYYDLFVTLCSLKLASLIASAAWSDVEFARNLENAYLRQSKEVGMLIADQSNITNASRL